MPGRRNTGSRWILLPEREAKTEGYYLTVQVSETPGVEVVNNRLNYVALSRKEGTLSSRPSRRKQALPVSWICGI